MLRRFALVALLLALSIEVSGCPPALFVAGGAAGAGAVVWVKGKLEEELNVPLGKVHQASLAGLKELELPIKEDRKDMLSAEIESQFADGKDIWISIRSLAESTTKITIRVGVLGDQPRSERIIEAIHRHL